jgi:uncharacterized protein YjbI with pentapeptide repeats
MIPAAVVALREMVVTAQGEAPPERCQPGSRKSLVGCDYFSMVGLGYGAIFPDTDFSGSDLTDAAFRCADLRRANFAHADLTRVDFTGADLRGASLSFANTRDTVFCRTKLSDDLVLDSGCAQASFETFCPTPSE